MITESQQSKARFSRRSSIMRQAPPDAARGLSPESLPSNPRERASADATIHDVGLRDGRKILLLQGYSFMATLPDGTYDAIVIEADHTRRNRFPTRTDNYARTPHRARDRAPRTPCRHKPAPRGSRSGPARIPRRSRHSHRSRRGFRPSDRSLHDPRSCAVNRSPRRIRVGI